MRIVAAEVRAVRHNYAGLQLMAAEPLLEGQLINRTELILVRRSGPTIEEIATPALWRDEHVFRPLAMCVAVESRVAKHRAQQRARGKLIAVVGTQGHTPHPVISGCTLGHQRADVGELRADRKRVCRDK